MKKRCKPHKYKVLGNANCFLKFNKIVVFLNIRRGEKYTLGGYLKLDKTGLSRKDGIGGLSTHQLKNWRYSHFQPNNRSKYRKNKQKYEFTDNSTLQKHYISPSYPHSQKHPKI